MTIVFDPSNKPKATAPPAAAVEREQDDRRPLLPPSYSAEHPADQPAPAVTKQRTSQNKLYGKWLAVGLVLIGLGVLALFKLLAHGSPFGNEDWMIPPVADGKPTTPSALPLPSRHTHGRHPSWPGQPLFSRTINIDLPLSSSNPDFFLHALGTDAVGEVKMIPEDESEGKHPDGVVRVEVVVVYASEDRLNERVRIWKVKDDDGRIGVDILTPSDRSWNLRASDHISFEVTIRLPARMSGSSSWHNTLLLGSFDGEATGMRMDVGDIGNKWRFGSFNWRSRNSQINVQTLNSHAIDLTTTNGHIALLSNPNRRMGLNATDLRLTTTNANVDLVEGIFRATSSVRINTTNGHVAARPSEDDGSEPPLFVEDGIIDIRTTNEAIRGSFSASSISAITTNGKISGSFSGFKTLLNLRTTNAPIITHLFPPSSSSSSPIPITLHTTTGLISATFPSTPHAIVNVDLSTTNDKLEVKAPAFKGEFEFRTSNAALEVLGEGVEVDEARKGEVKGRVRGKEGRGEGGRLVGRTSNGAVKVQF